MKTLTSREFNRDTGSAKRAATQGPVFITDRGEPSHVLMSITEYRRIVGQQRTIAELLAMPSGDPIEFYAPERKDDRLRPADLA
jgi:prevent-host-death family protein